MRLEEFLYFFFFFFSSRRRHTRSLCDWSSDVCSSDLDEADQRGAPLEEKGSDHENYEHGSDDQRRRKVVDRLLDKGRGPEDGRVDLHAGQTWAKVVDRFLDAPGDVQGVRPRKLL